MTKGVNQTGSSIGYSTGAYAEAYPESSGTGDLTLIHCPDCGMEITGIIADEIRDCADHLSHGDLQEHYRWLKKEHQRLRNGSK